MSVLTKRPLQVYHEDHQDRALRQLAASEGVTLSELIRRSVDLLLAQMPIERDPAWHLIGLGSSDVNDLGKRHDDHLSTSLAHEIQR